MGSLDTVLELALLGLLGMTLLHALRLQRALSGLRGDRAALQAAVAGFDGGTRQAEAALARMQGLAEALSAQHDRSTALRDDLAYLSDRGEGLADRLEASVRSARGLEPALAPQRAQEVTSTPLRSQAERNLMVALQGRR